ncbi:MAG: HAMP domain-containing sensor histidine kinase [Candidatus Edwardsbacteria bacterium]|nr:HAMP domain-containing sensor histidine kinase [Candidatus Edwardsbacteria bacterium]
MAHEIRNPLNSIAGFAQLLQMKVEEADPRRKFVDIIVQEAFRIDTLISDILDFAHQKKTVITDIDFGQLTNKVVSAKKDAAQKKGATLACTATPGLPPVRGDSVRLERVLLNLVNNALDATESGGAVTVAAAPAESGGIPGIQLTVADTGCGIPPEHLEAVFKPFFTTKQTGTGLGLAIVQKIAEEHNGTVSVASAPGRGTSFTVFLPAATDLSPTPLLKH